MLKDEYLYTNVDKYYLVGIMESKNITLRVNSKLYETYKEFCKKKGLLVSRQFEKLMEKDLRLQRDG